MKKFIFSLLFFISLICYGQQLNYLERFRLIERFGHEKHINLSEVSHEELAHIMRFAGGLDATPLQAGNLQRKIQYLDELIHSSQQPIRPQDLIDFGLSPTQTETLAKLINEGSRDPSPQTFLAAAKAHEAQIPLVSIKYLDDLIKEATRPSRPNSPTSLSLKRIFRRTAKIQKIRTPKPSGDYFSSLSASLDYSYTEFSDNSLGTFGHFHDWSASLNGAIAENTDLSIGFIASESDSSGTIGSEYRSDTYGGDLMLMHKLTDNYGVGVFGFYQHSDYETLDTRDYGTGMGMLFSTWHSFEWFEISTVNSLTKTYYEAGNDTLFNSSIELTKYWTDRFSTSFRTMFTDSTDSDTPGDNTYWTFGGSVGYMLTDQLYITLGYGTDESIKDYESETWNIGFTWNF